MLKSVRLNLLLCLTLLASIGAVTAQVQQQPQAETATTDVSDKELNKFATAFQAIQMENQKAQQEMVTIIEENGLYWTKKVTLSKRIIDPLGVGLFRMQEPYFFKGIIINWIFSCILMK
jgi:hypothetical protein